MDFFGERHPLTPAPLPPGEREEEGRGEGFGFFGVTGLVWDLSFVGADPFSGFPITNVGNDSLVDVGKDRVRNGGKDGLVEGRGVGI